jgi:hypothetical protein
MGTVQIGEDSIEQQWWGPWTKEPRIEQEIAQSIDYDVDHMNKIDTDFSVALVKGSQASPPRESTEENNR